VRGPRGRASGQAGGLILEFKKKHYATWVDEALPALGGQTPRNAVQTRDGRNDVDLLLKDFEHREAQEPTAQRFDFSALRAELGLED